ncbi:hypothetical protein C8R47DRAFT_594044 [Mycena vitilis]|nr:hypothetical protein C8R47DRAFT_594044 [Mycena vitilis]
MNGASSWSDSGRSSFRLALHKNARASRSVLLPFEGFTHSFAPEGGRVWGLRRRIPCPQDGRTSPRRSRAGGTQPRCRITLDPLGSRPEVERALVSRASPAHQRCLRPLRTHRVDLSVHASTFRASSALAPNSPPPTRSPRGPAHRSQATYHRPPIHAMRSGQGVTGLFAAQRAQLLRHLLHPHHHTTTPLRPATRPRIRCAQTPRNRGYRCPVFSPSVRPSVRPVRISAPSRIATHDSPP